eukprot:12641579-Prorocentrum_lima.AAC.1
MATDIPALFSSRCRLREIFVYCYWGNRHSFPGFKRVMAQQSQEEAHGTPVVLGGLCHAPGAPAIANQTW